MSERQAALEEAKKKEKAAGKPLTPLELQEQVRLVKGQCVRCGAKYPATPIEHIWCPHCRDKVLPKASLRYKNKGGLFGRDVKHVSNPKNNFSHR